jgi:hypothetical protein
MHAYLYDHTLFSCLLGGQTLFHYIAHLLFPSNETVQRYVTLDLIHWVGNVFRIGKTQWEGKHSTLFGWHNLLKLK